MSIEIIELNYDIYYIYIDYLYIDQYCHSKKCSRKPIRNMIFFNVNQHSNNLQSAKYGFQ